MFMPPVALAAVLIGIAATPACAEALTTAEAVTYTGTVGGQAIVLELSEAGGGPLVGRYSYQANGADIPLHGLGATDDDVVMVEEVPCTPALCVRPDGNLVLDPPLGGQFDLQYSADNSKLTGSWRASATIGDALPVELTRFGQRAYALEDAFSYFSLIWMNYNNAPITPQTSPYDYAKMQVPVSQGSVQAWGGTTYRQVSDPRTKFLFPRVVALPGGGDTEAVNALLEQRRWATNFSGFECLSADYHSGVWMPLPFGTGGASLGGIEGDDVSITYLSDTVMTIRQAGRSSCGGGEPYDHIDYYTYDVRGGAPLDLSQIFKDWDAASGNPTQPLIDWVISAYQEFPGYDADRATGCVTPDYLIEGLDVSFAEDDVAVFLIVDSEDVACAGPVAAVPLAEIKDLLTDNAADYFPSLRS